MAAQHVVGGALLGGVVAEAIRGMVNALSGAATEAAATGVKNAARERLAHIGGFGISDNAKWAELRTGLTPSEDKIIDRLYESLEPHQKRNWRVLVTSMDIEGLCEHIERPYKEFHKGKPGEAPEVKKEGVEVKEVPARLTKSDPRLKHFRQLIAVYKSGKGLDEDARLAQARVYLFNNHISEHVFYYRIAKWYEKTLEQLANWYQEDSSGPTRWTRAKTYVQDRVNSLTLMWVELEIGEEALRKILDDGRLDADKVKAIEEALQLEVQGRLVCLRKRRGLPNTYWWMLAGLLVLITAASLFIMAGQSFTH